MDVLSEFSTMTCLFWAALQGAAHNFMMGETNWGGIWVLFWWAMLSKSLIQFSVDGWVCVPSLLFDLRPNYGGGNEDSGNLLLKVPCRHCCTQFPWPCTRPPLTSVSADPCLCQRLLDTHWQVWVKIIGGNILTKSFPWCWERLKGMTEDEKVGWHHQLDGHEFE